MNQDSIASKGGTSLSYATGATCPKTGSYKSETKYTTTVIVMVRGQAFPLGSDGRKTSWSALSSADGSKTSYDSVKVVAGTI